MSLEERKEELNKILDELIESMKSIKKFPELHDEHDEIDKRIEEIRIFRERPLNSEMTSEEKLKFIVDAFLLYETGAAFNQKLHDKMVKIVNHSKFTNFK